MRPADLVFWIDRKDIVHLGGQPRGPDDYRLVVCGEHRVRDLKRADNYIAPTCLKCVSRQPRS